MRPALVVERKEKTGKHVNNIARNSSLNGLGVQGIISGIYIKVAPPQIVLVLSLGVIVFIYLWCV